MAGMEPHRKPRLVAAMEVLSGQDRRNRGDEMTVEELAEKLREMRVEGPRDMMTRLFGVIFREDIGNRSKEIVDHYLRPNDAEVRDRGQGVHWPGKPNTSVINDGMNLAAFVDPRPAVVRQWRG